MTTGIQIRCISSKLRSLTVISLLLLVAYFFALMADPGYIMGAVSEIPIDQAMQTNTTSGNSLDVKIEPFSETTVNTKHQT
ncbi:MAG: hypothetical protein WCD28_11990 [Nitrososphaeraceae archaeon]